MTRRNTVRLIGNLLFIIIMIAIMVKAMEWERHFKLITLSSYNSYPHILFISFYPIAMGILLALPRFVRKLGEDGAWALDWVVLIAVGLPTLFVAVAPALYFSPASKYLPAVMALLFQYSLTPQIICGVISGYIMLSVFGKKDNMDFFPNNYKFPGL